MEGRSLGEWSSEARKYFLPFICEWASHVQMDELVDRQVSPVAWQLLQSGKTIQLPWSGVQYVANRWVVSACVQMPTDIEA